jgi:hypothetical protein
VLLIYAGSALAFTEGSKNNYFGIGAGPSGPSDSGNSFYGGYAGGVTTGGHNTFNGYHTGFFNTTGKNNTFIGSEAGAVNNTGNYNTFNGSYAGYYNSIGNDNTFNGYRAGFNNSSGAYNTFIGTYTGYSNTTGYDNTFYGYRAGYTNSTGSGNVFLGYNAGYNETGSDKLYIDNSNTSLPLIYGDFSTDTLTVNGAFTATTLSGDGSGLTGVTPAQVGAVDITGDTMTGPLYIDIGTTSPSYKLEVGDITTDTANYMRVNSSNWGGFLIYDGQGSHSGGISYFHGSDFMVFQTRDASGVWERMRITSNGNIGIGTPSPLSKLTVAGTIESTSGGFRFPDSSILTSANNINADTLDGHPALDFAGAIHSHSGSDIISGTVFEARIDALIARDDEIMTIVTMYDGKSSGVDADFLDGMNSSAFMSSSTDNWLDTAGDTMTGDLSVDSNFFVTGTAVINTDLYVDGNIYALSDASLKKNIQPIKSPLQKINSINGVTFLWKDSEENANRLSDSKHYGVIAQEVEDVLPELVKTDKNNSKRVAYMELVPVLIEAVKEQQKTIDSQNNINKIQQTTINDLLDKVDTLQKEMKLMNSMAMADIH